MSETTNTDGAAGADTQGGQTVPQDTTGGTSSPQPQETQGGQAGGSSLLGGGQTDGKDNQPQYEGAPEKYDWKNPEGKEYDPAFLDEYGKVAKELDLSQGKAQELIDKMTPVVQQRQTEAIQKEIKQWEETSRNDQEFGGNNLSENLGVAKTALDKYGTPELKQLMNQSGLGNHPEVIRFFYRVGKAIGVDGFVNGKQGDQQPRQSYAQQVYGG